MSLVTQLDKEASNFVSGLLLDFPYRHNQTYIRYNYFFVKTPLT